MGLNHSIHHLISTIQKHCTCATMIYSTESEAFNKYLAINVAPASSAIDFENAANLQLDVFKEIAALGLDKLVKLMVAKAVEGDYQCLVAIRQKVFMGSLDLTVKKSMSFLTDEVDKDESLVCAYITMVVVKHEYRRSGVASKLLREAMFIARREGMQRAVLHVEEGNIGAINCYKKAGFVISEFRVDSSVVMVKEL